MPNENAKLNFLHVCDYASLSEGGKLNVLGTFESMSSKETPYVHPQFYVVTNVSVKKFGNYKQFIKLTRDRDNQEIIKPFEFGMSVSEPKGTGQAKIGIIAQLNNIKFEEFGAYSIQIYIDSEKIGETKINVVSRD